MKNVFTISLAIIGAAIGFILGMTITFALNNNSPVVLYSVGAVLAFIGGFGLTRMAPFLDSQEKSIQQALTVLCAIIAVLFILFLLVMLSTLSIHYQR